MSRFQRIIPFHAAASAHARRYFPLVLLAFAALACGSPAKGPEPVRPNGEWSAIEGTLNATGYRQILRLGPDLKGAIFSLTGSLLLVGERRLGTGFQCRIIGLNNTRSGLEGWSTWTDTHGNQVFSELKGEPIGGNRRIQGTIIGGTGRYAGITGEYDFAWQLVVGDEKADEGDFNIWVDNVRGRFRLTAPGSSPPSRSSLLHESGRNRT